MSQNGHLMRGPHVDGKDCWEVCVFTALSRLLGQRSHVGGMASKSCWKVSQSIVGSDPEAEGSEGAAAEVSDPEAEGAAQGDGRRGVPREVRCC